MRGIVEGVPSGAREAPLDWVCMLRVERRSYFDKDEGGEAFTDHTTVTGWRAEPDPRVHTAGALSFRNVSVEPEVLLRFPGTETLGASLSVLHLEGKHLTSAALERINQARAWSDLSISDDSLWAPTVRSDWARVLSTFPALRGLELQRVLLSAEDLVTLSGIVEPLDELTLANIPLDPVGARAVIERPSTYSGTDCSQSRRARRVFFRSQPRATNRELAGRKSWFERPTHRRDGKVRGQAEVKLVLTRSSARSR